MNPDQASLLDDLIDTDIAAIEPELQALQIAPATTEKKQKPKRTALPAEFPRTLIHHEPDNTRCPCGCALKRIGEDVSEKLDYTPGVFTVERSEEHTSELQSLMRISYAVFCFKKKNKPDTSTKQTNHTTTIDTNTIIQKPND